MGCQSIKVFEKSLYHDYVYKFTALSVVVGNYKLPSTHFRHFRKSYNCSEGWRISETL